MNKINSHFVNSSPAGLRQLESNLKNGKLKKDQRLESHLKDFYTQVSLLRTLRSSLVENEAAVLGHYIDQLRNAFPTATEVIIQTNCFSTVKSAYAHVRTQTPVHQPARSPRVYRYDDVFISPLNFLPFNFSLSSG
jgi:hypothetical protein